MGRDRVTLPSIKEVSAETWATLATKRIYFGHMSVGFNIMAGVEDVLKENRHMKLNILETSNPGDFDKPLFAHSRVGRNHEPLSKIRSFSRFMEEGLGEKADIAFFKFCFVDINAKTDIHEVLVDYKKTMGELRRKYPHVAFVHVTMPLTAVQSGAKALVKKLIGRPIDGYEENISREAFNVLLRKEYEGKEQIFDLAILESTFADGRRKLFEKGGERFPSLVPEYTHDRGHLNEKGRKFVAEQLLIFLGTLLS